MIRPSDIIETIRGMGVRPGDLMIAHSSYKSFGEPVETGPRAVAEALVATVSPGGSVFVPTFNYGQAPYDPAMTRSFDGIISEFFRQLPGAQRSAHPTHPLTGVGPAARDILSTHDASRGVFAEGTPFWKLWQRNAWILLIGCGHESNSTIHVAEEIAAVAYLSRTRIGNIWRDGRVVEVTVRRPGCSNGFVKIAPRLSPVVAQVGTSRLMLMRAQDVVAAALQMLREDPASLLCNCEVCNEARELIQAAAAEPQAKREP